MAEKYRNYGKKSKYQLIDEIKQRDNRILNIRNEEGRLYNEIDELKAQLKAKDETIHKLVEGIKEYEKESQ